MGWGTSATIGFNAGGEAFENNEYTTNAIACSNLPASTITNVIYRLSEENVEYVLPRKTIYNSQVHIPLIEQYPTSYLQKILW